MESRRMERFWHSFTQRENRTFLALRSVGTKGKWGAEASCVLPTISYMGHTMCRVIQNTI